MSNKSKDNIYNLFIDKLNKDGIDDNTKLLIEIMEDKINSRIKKIDNETLKYRCSCPYGCNLTWDDSQFSNVIFEIFYHIKRSDFSILKDN